jgi:hypothetical protein
VGIEFHKEGFVAKRMVFDTHLPKAKADAEFVIEPITMEVGMLERARYEGANTDDLDFPFAIVKWDRTLGTFAQDQEYTMGHAAHQRRIVAHGRPQRKTLNRTARDPRRPSMLILATLGVLLCGAFTVPRPPDAGDHVLNVLGRAMDMNDKPLTVCGSTITRKAG